MTRTNGRPAMYWGVTRTATHLNMHPDTIRRLFDEGHLSGIRSKTGYRMIDPTSVNNYQNFRTCTQAAAELECSTSKIQDLYDSGKLWGFRTPGGRRRIDVRSLEAFKATSS